MLITNCFCAIYDQNKDHLPARTIFRDSHPHKSPPAGSEPAYNLSVGFDERSYAVVITARSQYHQYLVFNKKQATGSIQLISSLFNCIKIKLHN